MRSGRPKGAAKQTAQARHALCEALRKGHTIKTACDLAGLSERTYYYWMARARSGEATEEELHFAAAVARARAEAQDSLVTLVVEAAHDPKNWRAAAWILERRWSKDWGESLPQRAESEIQSEVNVLLRKIKASCDQHTWDQVVGVVQSMGDSAS